MPHAAKPPTAPRPVLRLRSAGAYRAILASQGGEPTGQTPTIHNYIEAEVELAAGLQATGLRDVLETDPLRSAALIAMADEVTTLLKEGLHLFALCGPFLRGARSRRRRPSRSYMCKALI